MMRVLVVGTSCSGKSTFARKLSTACEILHIELDALHWGPDWTPRPKAELREQVARQIVQDAWVLDGNYSSLRDITWPRATHAVWLNIPFPIVFARAVRRTFHRVVHQEELFGGNHETWRQALFDWDSIPYWVIRTFRKKRREFQVLFDDEQFKHLQVVEVCSGKGASEVLTQLVTSYEACQPTWNSNEACC